MIAYLLETEPYGDYEIATELDDYAGATIVHTLELTASYDHGLRTADETAFVIGCEAAASVLVPILCAVWGRPVESFRWDIDYAAALQLGADIDYRGEDWADDGDTSGALYEWCDEMIDAAQSVGWIIDSSADCGMTWFYRPLPAPIFDAATTRALDNFGHGRP